MRRFIASLLGIVAMVSAACSPAAPTPPSQGGAQSGGQAPAVDKRAAKQTVTIAKVGIPGSASPESSSTNNEIFSNLYDGLVQFGPKFEILPAAAEKWEFRPQENSWRFTIRKDMTFSDGVKLTADDIVYSVKFAVDKNMPTKTFFPSVVDAKKVDDYTVDIISKAPDVTVLNGGPWMWIFPAKYHAEQGAQFGNKPIGSGPYELLEYKAADTIAFKLRSTPHPFRKPTFTEVRFRAIPELGQQVNGLRTGDLDAVSLTGFTADQVDQLKSAGLNVIIKLLGNVSALYSQPEGIARNTPLTNIKVREALNYAVNKDAIAKGLFKGLAEPAGQIGIPDSPFWDDSVKPYPYDPAKAKQMLAEAGYPNGFKLPVGIGYTPQTADPNMVLALQSDLKAVGVEAEVKSYEFATFLDQYYGRNGQQKGDLFIQSLGDSNGSFSQGRGLYDCAKKEYEVWWCNKEFNRLYDSAVMEPDPAKRATIMRQANAAMRADIPQIQMVMTSQFMVLSPKIKGFVWRTGLSFNFDTAYLVE